MYILENEKKFEIDIDGISPEQITEKLRDFFPDGNFVVHSTDINDATFGNAEKIFQDGYIKSILESLKEGKPLARNFRSWTTLPQISFWFNDIARADTRGVTFVFPLKSVLYSDMDLEQGSDFAELQLVPRGWQNYKEKFSVLTQLLNTYDCMRIDWLDGGYRAYKARNATSGENLQTFKEYLLGFSPKFIGNIESIKTLIINPVSIIGWVVHKEFRSEVAEPNIVEKIVQRCREITLYLIEERTKDISLAQTKVPIEDAVIFVPSDRVDQWLEIARKTGRKPLAILAQSMRYNAISQIPKSAIPPNVDLRNVIIRGTFTTNTDHAYCGFEIISQKGGNEVFRHPNPPLNQNLQLQNPRRNEKSSYSLQNSNPPQTDNKTTKIDKGLKHKFGSIPAIT